MDQPGRLFNLFQSIRNPGSNSLTGNAAVDTVIETLPPLELARLLRHVRNWNANNRTYVVAQTILHAILKLHTIQSIIDAFNTGEPEVLAEMNGDADDKPPVKDKDLRALGDLLDGLIPYTERHLNRAQKLVEESYVLDFILSEMDSGVVPDEMDYGVTKLDVHSGTKENGLPESKGMTEDMAAMEIEDHEWGGL
jgi:U3 small nucleolar RNA-associated protein 13